MDFNGINFGFGAGLTATETTRAINIEYECVLAITELVGKHHLEMKCFIPQQEGSIHRFLTPECRLFT